jgi:serine/threonine-protein kinase
MEGERRSKSSSMSYRLVQLALALFALAGCAAPSQPQDLREWALRSDGLAPQRLVLPTHVNLPARPSTFRLSRQVYIPEAWRGRDLRLRVENWQGIAELSVAGHSLPLDEQRKYRGSGYNVWLIEARHTNVAYLPVELNVRHTWQKSAWLDGVPTLEAADERSPSSPAHIAESAGIVLALGTTVSFALFFGALFLLDRRRREHGFFALFAAASATYPLFVSTWFESSAGFNESIAFGVAQACSPVLGYSLSRAMFGAPPIDRHHWLLPLLVLAVGTLSGPFQSVTFAKLTTLAILPAALAHFWFLLRLARRGERTALAMLVAWTTATVATACFEGSYYVGRGVLPFPGFHPALYANTALMLLHAALLAARHVQSLRTIEVLNEELRLRVNDTSDALSRAVWRLIATTDSEMPGPGDVVDGRYRITAALGEGGMGCVWKAVRLHDGLPVAVKILRDASSTMVLARFAREARLASSILHPNIVRVHDVAVADRGFMYLVMELVDGVSLSSMRASFGDVEWATGILRGVLRALVALHARGIVHRDIKPSNVVLQLHQGREIPKLVDFGVAFHSPDARRAQAEGTATDEPTTLGNSEQHEARAIAGTPRYMPPEVIHEGAQASAAGDVYSFAVLAHELLFGRLPFEGSASDSQPPPPASGPRGAWLDPEHPFAILLEHALGSHPEHRPLARELLVALDAPARHGAAEDECA